MSLNTYSVLADTHSDDPKQLAKLAEKRQSQQATQDKGKKQEAKTPSQKKNLGEIEEYASKQQRGGKQTRGTRAPFPRRGGKPMDRSVSRNTRGRGVKRQGGGSYNWGDNANAAKEYDAFQVDTNKAGEENTTEEQAEGAAAASEKEGKEEAPKTNELSFEEFQKSQLEGKKKFETLKPSGRKTGEVQYDSAVKVKGVVVKKEESLLKVGKEQKEGEKPKEAEKPKSEKKKPETMHITDFLADVPEPQRNNYERRDNTERRGRGGRGGRGSRGGRGGRGGDRGGRGRRRGPNPPNFQDENLFPSLGVK